MVDRYGRIGAEDWNALTGLINTLSAVNQRNTIFKQQQEDRAKQQQLEADTETAYKAYKNPKTGQPYGDSSGYEVPGEPVKPEQAMAGLPSQAQVAGKMRYAQELQADAAIRSSQSAISLDAATSKALAHVKQHGLQGFQDQMFDKDPLVNQKAQTIAMSMLRESDETKTAYKAARRQEQERAFGIVQSTQNALQKKMASGDREGVAASLMNLVDDVPIPYRLRNYDPKTGTIEKQYLTSKTGQYEAAGRIKLEDAVAMVNDMTKEKFMGFMDASYDTITEQNFLSAMNPQNLTTKDGRTLHYWTQKNVYSPELAYFVRDAQTNKVQQFKSQEDILKAFPGVKQEDLKRELSLKQLQKADEELRSVKELTAQRERSAMNERAEDISKALKQYKDGLSLVLSPFAAKSGSGDAVAELLSEDGNLSAAGETALQTAMNFYEQNKDRPETLNETGKMKLQAAGQAVALWTQGRQLISQAHGLQGLPQQTSEQAQGGDAQPYQGNTPPPEHPNARRGKNGLWYDQTGGKWFVVMVDGEEEESQADPESALTGEPTVQNADTPAYEAPPAPEQPADPEPSLQPIGTVNGKPVARSHRGYVVQDGDQWRPATAEEYEQIVLMGRKGKLGQTNAWTMPAYQTKYPNQGVLPNAGAMQNRRVFPPNLSGRM